MHRKPKCRKPKCGRQTDMVIPVYPPNFVAGGGIKIVAAFRGMHVLPAKHSYGTVKDEQTDRRI